MASPLHQTLVDLLRHAPEVVPRLLTAAGASSGDAVASVRLIDSVLDQIQRRVDLAVEVRGEGAACLAVGLEIQLAINPEKLRSWPVYVTTLRSPTRPLACLLILAPDPRVAAWAARPIDLGPGNAAFRVHVIGPDQIPRIVDLPAARRQPELSFLSALAHAETDRDPALVRAALAGLGTLDSARTSSYVSVLLDSLGVDLRGALENCIMETPEHKPSSVTPEFVQRALEWARIGLIEAERREARIEALAEGRAEGREEGRHAGLEEGRHAGLAEGRHAGLAEGRHEGELHARREILGRLLVRAGLHATVDEQARIAACEDTAVLDRWIEQILGAQDVAQVLA
jgi:hypothetical protein